MLVHTRQEHDTAYGTLPPARAESGESSGLNFASVLITERSGPTHSCSCSCLFIHSFSSVPIRARSCIRPLFLCLVSSYPICTFDQDMWW
jgi:hypothetical protein